MQTKKVILVGDGGVGKTTFVKRMTYQNFDPKYVATLGVEVNPIVDEKRNIEYSIWDCAGQEKFGGLRDGYYFGSNIGLIMYSADSRISRQSVSNWKRDIKRVCPDISIYVLCNKIDVKTLKNVGDNIISCKNDIYREQVFNMLAGKAYSLLSSRSLISLISNNVNFVTSDDIKQTITKYAEIKYGYGKTFFHLLTKIKKDNAYSILRMCNITLFLKCDDNNESMMEHFNYNYVKTNEGLYINASLYLWMEFIRSDIIDICNDVYNVIDEKFPRLEYLLK